MAQLVLARQAPAGRPKISRANGPIVLDIHGHRAYIQGMKQSLGARSARVAKGAPTCRLGHTVGGNPEFCYMGHVMGSKVQSGGMMKPKIEWLSSGGPNDPAANILLDGENIGRVRHEGIGWVWYVRGTRRGGYANINQLLRDAVKHYRKLAAIEGSN